MFLASANRKEHSALRYFRAFIETLRRGSFAIHKRTAENFQISLCRTKNGIICDPDLNQLQNKKSR